MALDADNVRVALTGAVYVAPRGTTMPTSVASALDAAFVDLGYLSDDGVSLSSDVKSKETTAWQNADVVRRSLDISRSVKFTMLETNSVTLGLYFASTVVLSGSGTATTVGAPNIDKVAIVLDYIDGDELCRYAIPVCGLSDLDDLDHKNAEAVQYGVEMSIYRVNGVDYKHYTTALV